jgi:outer membrane protein OmpA-like peptidoglycan-associated protein
LFFLFISLPSGAQVLNNKQGNSHQSIKAEFVKQNIKIKPRSAFFNVLKIINTSNRQQSFNLQYETPVGWALITEKQKRLSIEPGDTLAIPLRASANKKVKGEIGYSIIASLTSRSGEPITTAYCFLKVPRQSSLSFFPLTRVAYIDQNKRTGSFSFRLANDGNVDEVIYMEFQSSSNIRIPQETNNRYSTDIMLPSKTDTTITYSVELPEGAGEVSMYRINLTGHTEDDRFNSTFWFKNLVSSYTHEMPSSEIPLIVDLNLENIFSERGSYLTGMAKGNILFKNNKEIYYYYRKYSRTGTDRNFLQNHRFQLEYQSKKLEVTLGDRIPFSLINAYGKGGYVNYNFSNDFGVEAKFRSSLFHSISNYGVGFNFNAFSSRAHLETNFEYSDDRYRKKDIMLGEFKNRINLTEDHNLTSKIGASWVKDSLSSISDLGAHYYINYTGKFDEFKVRLNNRYNSTDYYGGVYGRNDLNLNVFYPYRNNYDFRLSFRNNLYKPSTLMNGGNLTGKYSLQRDITFRTTKQLGSFSLYGEPIYEYYNSNSFYNYTMDKPFILNSGFLRVGGRLNFDNYSRFTTSFKGGITNVTNYSEGERNTSEIGMLESRNNSFTGVFRLAYYSRDWGIFFRYNYGPYNGNQYYNYFYSGDFTQLLRLMPYYRAYLYKDIIQLDSRVNYMYSLNRSTHRLNLGNEVRFHLDYGLMLRFIANFSLQSTMGESQRVQMQEKQKYTYSNSYFELRLQKRFNWNQPRLKYYNLNVNLYKDLNGNLKKDPSEPGIKNVLVNIEKLDPSKIDSIDVNYGTTGNLARNRLLSGMSGQVTYKNIPQGVYKIKLKNVGKQKGKYSADQQEILVHIDQDRTISIPYLERNKIFGKVILNRSKLSNLGAINISNIKVTAEDSKGRKTSTLTDKNGEFTLYAPSVDLYDVYINNIFQEHFDLRKNHYKVQLNGYKQFEVNFIFDEKRRQINFSPSVSETDVEVKSVKRTNLTGVVKDENTLQPVRATIEVVDNKTGSTVETTHSDRETGRFSMSFMTGTNYSLIVTAQGYWFYSEELDLDQMLTIQDIEKEILLENIIIGSKIELDNLRFAAGSAEIPDDAKPELDRLINQLKENPNVRIQIAGHADALEQLDNENISEERAKAVAKYMMKNGFSNIEYAGYKDKNPVAPNDSPENRAQNRRVEITVVDK